MLVHRARCGLDDKHICPTHIFLNLDVSFAVFESVARVAMEFAPKPRLFALSCSSIFRIRTEKFVLAGPLGFEPRQSAPKALDLPLVDGPVKSLSISIADCR